MRESASALAAQHSALPFRTPHLALTHDALTADAAVTEIRVERRRRIGVWPWLAGVLVLALAIWALAELLGEDDGDEVVDQLGTQSAPATTPPPR